MRKTNPNKLIARLMRFYGGSVQDWEALSLNEIKGYISYIPALKAEENLNMVNVLAIGNGLMAKGKQQSMINEWYRISGGIVNHRNKLSRKQRATVLASMGIGYKCQKN